MENWEWPRNGQGKWPPRTGHPGTSKVEIVALEVEAAGNVDLSITSFTLTYSAPLAPGTVATGDGAFMLQNATLAATGGMNIEKGTIKFTPDSALNNTTGLIQLTDLNLDVSDATGPVTVTVTIERAEDGARSSDWTGYRDGHH